jgi:trehalose synthase
MLKDPLGVIRGFAEHVGEDTGAHLMCAGPNVDAVDDDPEGARVLAEAVALRDSLPPAARRRVHLAALPMQDPEENAIIVNALQRHASVVVQKSLAEGFGLTVAEAMWKARPVVASRIGGIQDQIVDGESGVLLDDPRDLQSYGAAVTGLLAEPERAERMGERAHERVRTRFMSVHSLLDYLAVIRGLDSPHPRAPARVHSA